MKNEEKLMKETKDWNNWRIRLGKMRRTEKNEDWKTEK